MFVTPERLFGKFASNMKILVYGWYNSGNIGDNLFCEAFSKLFPSHQFSYTKVITKENIADVEAVFFGGGSLLDGEPKIKPDALALLESKKIFYIGTGTETGIHPIHLRLMKIAKLIATRSIGKVDELKAINPNSIWIPDLVYALKEDRQLSPITNKSVIVLPNIELVPKWTDPHWKHVAWEYFKTQFAQFLDTIVEDGYTLDFLSMCSNETMNDSWAATEIINKMKNRKSKYQLLDPKSNFADITNLLSRYSIIITQRFHGVVLSEILDKPYIAIHHHDKIKNCYPARGNSVPYYEISKHKVVENFLQLKQLNDNVDMDFNELREQVTKHLVGE